MTSKSTAVPPSVLRIITRLNVGGPARQVVYLNDELPRRGIPSELVTGIEAPREGRVDPGTDRVTVVPSLRRDVHPVLDAQAEQSLMRIVRRRRPAIVHTHLAKAGMLGRIAAIRARVPVVIHTFHGHVLDGYFPDWKNRAFVQAERAIARRTDALLAVSAAVRDELLDLGIGSAQQWHVVPVGLDLEPFRTRRPKGAAREALGLPADHLLVGIVGRLVAIKDHDTFFDAAAQIAAQRSDVTFVVAGDGELEPQLRRRADAALGSRGRFLGWVHDLPSLYAALDLVVLSSRSEGTPVSLIEAGASGLPAVATRVGGVSDVVRDDVTGLLAPAGDTALLATLIGDLLDDPDRRERMGAAASAWVVDRFAARRLASDLESLYAELVGRSARR